MASFPALTRRRSCSWGARSSTGSDSTQRAAVVTGDRSSRAMAMASAPSASLLDRLTAATATEVVARAGDAWGPARADFGGDAQALAAALLGYGLAPGG